MTRAELLRAAVVDLFKLVGDVDGVVQDMLERPHKRELGPVLHASLYGDALEGILDNLRHMARILEHNDDGNGGPPGDDAPPWEPGADPTRPTH